MSATLIRRQLLGAGVAALAGGAAMLAGPAQADAVGDFYKGKTVTILIGHPPGGSYDLYAQLAAAHIGRFIPGNPNVVVEHRPGGGGGKAAVYFFNKAPKDGTVIALLPESLANTQMIDPKRGRWDMRNAEYIGSFSDANSAWGIRADAPAKSIKEMMKTPINSGCTGRTSPSGQSPRIAKNLGGLKINMICGYAGSGPFMLALQRGEVDMIVMAWLTWNAKLSDEVKAGKFKIVAQTGAERSTEIPDVPLIQELVEAPDAKKALEFMATTDAIGRALLTLPGTPKDRLEAMRAGFDKLVKDPTFLADAKKRRAIIAPKAGKDLKKYVMAVLNTPKDVVELAKKGMAGYQANCTKNCGKKK